MLITVAAGDPLGLSRSSGERGRIPYGNKTRLSTRLSLSLTSAVEIVAKNQPMLSKTFIAATATGGPSSDQGSTLHSNLHTVHG